MNIKKHPGICVFIILLIFSICIIYLLTNIKHTPTVTTILQPTILSDDNFHTYPWHTHIRSTTFWVGEIFEPSVSDGSQVCSTYDIDWAYHYTGTYTRVLPSNSVACALSHSGGCDGIISDESSGKVCHTEARRKNNNYFPSNIITKENPFYVSLPYDDVNDELGFSNRCINIPWSMDKKYAGHCTDANFSYMKNYWVEIIGPTGQTCYGQIEDAGPSHDELYHDATYVFGTKNVRPSQTYFNNSGMDISPALNGCLAFSELDGEGEFIRWRFINETHVPNGPWKQIITASQVSK